MKIHEYQAKNLFSQYGLPVDKNIIAHSVEEAIDAYNQLGCKKIVVKNNTINVFFLYIL